MSIYEENLICSSKDFILYTLNINEERIGKLTAHQT